MIIPEFWRESWTAAVMNHLWQSTVVVGIAWLLAFVLRKNHSGVRYRLWMVASIKFLVPFSLVTRAGEWIRSLIPAPAAQPAVASVMEQVTQPFGQTQFLVSENASNVPTAIHQTSLLPMVLVTAWLCGVLIVAIRFGHAWAKVNAAKRGGRPLELAAEVPVFSSSASIEPGICGVFRPVLMLPEGILERLSGEQMGTVIAHEMCHVRRRDNLTFAIHMVVETLFWFHPLVWWIGTRLIDEREQACDEAVVQAGGKAQVYAEGILNVCKFYVESPLPFFSGVTGADLKKRIVRIMSEGVARDLSVHKRALLVAVGVAAIVAPLTLGLFRSASIFAQSGTEDTVANLPKFEVVSIKEDKASICPSGSGIMPSPDALYVTCMPLHWIIRLAYNIDSDDRMLGEPDWDRHTNYDITAKVAPSDIARFRKLNRIQWGVMLQSVLAARFELKVHYETKVRPVYTLVVGKGGPRLATGKDAPPMMAMRKRGDIECRNCELSAMPMFLSQLVGGTVIDKTGLAGRYNFTLHWAPDTSRDTASIEDSGPSIFTALREQLGLKLEYRRAPVDVLVVDHVEKPSPN